MPGLGSIRALAAEAPPCIGEMEGRARSFFSSPVRFPGRTQGPVWGGKLGCISMTTTQAQGQFHHLETKQDTDRRREYLLGSLESPKGEPVCTGGRERKGGRKGLEIDKTEAGSVKRLCCLQEEPSKAAKAELMARSHKERQSEGLVPSPVPRGTGRCVLLEQSTHHI